MKGYRVKNLDAFVNENNDEKKDSGDSGDAFINDSVPNYFSFQYKDVGSLFAKFTSKIVYHVIVTDELLVVKFYEFENIFTGKIKYIKEFKLVSGYENNHNIIESLLKYCMANRIHVDRKLLRLLIKRGGIPLWYVPKRQRTLEVCIKYVGITHRNFYHVPQEHRNVEVYKLAMVRDKSGNSHWFSDAEKATREHWIAKLEVSGKYFDLGDVPARYKTFEYCRAAVIKNGANLRYIPDNLDEILTPIAIAHDPYAYEYAINKTYELSLKTVIREPVMLDNVPDEHKTFELCAEAVKRKPKMIRAVPDRHKGPKLYLVMVQGHGYGLRYIPNKFQTDELRQIADKGDMVEKYDKKDFFGNLLNGDIDMFGYSESE